MNLNTNPSDTTLSEHSRAAWALKGWAEDLKCLDGMDKSDFRSLFFRDATKDYFETKWDLFCSDKLRFIWGVIHNIDLLERIMYYISWNKGVVE